MAKRGRPAIAGQMKVLQGNFRKDRDSHGPAVEIGVPECPKDAPDVVRIAWKKMAPTLANQGMLSSCDQVTLFAYLDVYTKFKMVSASLDTLSSMIDTTPNGHKQMSAGMIVYNNLWKKVVEAGKEFGHTPASRSGMKASNQGQMDFGGFEDL